MQSHRAMSGAVVSSRRKPATACRVFSVTLLAVAALIAMPAAANAAFSVNQSFTPLSTVGAAHPDLVITSDFSGTPQVSSLAFVLPAGLTIAPAAVHDRCPLADVQSGSCAPSAQIGTASIAAQGMTTATGTVHLTAAPTPDYAAGVAISVDIPGAMGSVTIQGGLKFNFNGSAQQAEQLEFTSIPSETSNANPLQITQLSFTLSGATGAPDHPLVTNPSSCPTTAATVTTTASAGDGSTAQAVTAYPVTTCASIPATMTTDISLSNPIAGQNTNLTAAQYYPPGSSAVRNFSVRFDRSLSYSYQGTSWALADRCPSFASGYPGSTATFDPAACPPQAKVGTVEFTSPALPTPLTGDLYIVSGGMFGFYGYSVDSGGVSLRGTGILGVTQVDPNCNSGEPDYDFCQQQFGVTLTAPAIPLTQAKMSFGGAQGRATSTGKLLSTDIWYVMGSGGCSSPNNFTAVAGFLKGAAASSTFPMGLLLCNSVNPPSTVITSNWTGRPTALSQPPFQFTGDGDTSSFECRIDHDAFSACSPGWSPAAPLADGTHNFTVRAVGSAGPDPFPPSVGFTVDTTPPAAPVITSPTEGETVTSSPPQATFTIEPGATATCSIDGGSFTACSSPLLMPALTDGSHTLAVKQADQAGNTSQAATRTFIEQSALSLSQGVSASTTAGAAHPTLTLTSNISGAPNLTSVKYTLPPGLIVGSAAVANPCTVVDASAGNCDASSKIGSATITASSGTVASGDVYMTAAPAAQNAAGIAIEADVPGDGTIVATGSLTIDLNNNVRLSEVIQIDSIPGTTSTGTPFKVSQFSITLNGSAGAPQHPLVTNPSSCPSTAATLTTAITGSDGSVAQAASAYPVTACSSISAAASLVGSLSNPVANATTNNDLTASFAPAGTSVNSIQYVLGQMIGENFPAWPMNADSCPSSPSTLIEFHAENCPPQAKIGTVTINSPVLSAPLVGTLYAAGQNALASFLAFDITGGGVRIQRTGAGTGIRQDDPNCDPSEVGFCPAQWYAAISLPPIPVSSVEISFGREPGLTRSTGEPLATDFWFVTPDGTGTCPLWTTPRMYASVTRGPPSLSAIAPSIPIFGC